MSTTRAQAEAAAANGLDADVAAAIRRLPAFIRAPIFMPTERMPPADALAGLERVAALYDDDLEATHRPRLRAQKHARQARRCFIIGNGPSLARTDLGMLRSEITFATNGFFLKMPELDWSPTYYVVEDHLVGEDRALELTALSGTTKLFPASLAYAIPPDENTIYFDHRPRKSYPDGFDFSFDADVNTYTGGTVTFTCMQLAAYFGFQEIYLIGVDADYSIPADAALSGGGRVKEIDMRSDDPNHFHPDYFGKGKRWHEPNVDVMLGAYAEARRATEARGVSIVNATVGGKLEVFPRIDYGMLFRPTPVERLLIIDHTRVGDGTATGEVKAAVLGNWPSDRVLQLYDRGHGRLRISGGPTEIDDPESLVDQIEVFDPDLVLYRPVPRKEALHGFAMELIERTKLPLALWIVDDWPSAFALENPVGAIALDVDFRWLLGRADARFSISPAMSQAFHVRYGYPFVPIANGVDRADWPTAQPRLDGSLTVRYAGSLAENMTLASVGLVARVIEQLAEEGLDISFEIKTHGHWRSAGAEWMTELQHTTISTSDLPRVAYRRWLAEADVLLLAYNFDDRSRDYIRYSLANKLPECLASGAAVLAIGPDDVGTIAAMASLDVGERVTAPDEELIKDTLRRLAASPERRFDLARRSQEIAFSLFGVGQMRRAFDSAVGRVAAAHHAGEYPADLQASVDEAAAIASITGEAEVPTAVAFDLASGETAQVEGVTRWRVRGIEPDAARREALAERLAGPRAASWLSAGTALREQGYAVYVSEWHPRSSGSARAAWRRVAPFAEQLDVHPAASGQLLAFRDDPGWTVIRRAFDRHIQRGDSRPAAPPPRAAFPDTLASGAATPPTEAPQAQLAEAPRRRTKRVKVRRAYAPFSRWLKPRAPRLHRALRVVRRGAAHLWRRRRWTIPAAVALGVWMLLGLLPALAAVSWLIWGAGALAAVGLTNLYVAFRLRRRTRALSKEVIRLRDARAAYDRKFSSASARITRLERAVVESLALNTDLVRKLTRMEASLIATAVAPAAIEREPARAEAPRVIEPVAAAPASPSVTESRPVGAALESRPAAAALEVHASSEAERSRSSNAALRLNGRPGLRGGPKAAGKAAPKAAPRAAGKAGRKGAAKPRPHGHALLVDLLPRLLPSANGVLVEVGTTREKMEGQGSTVELAKLANRLGLEFVTVDMDPVNTKQAQADLATFTSAEAVTAKGEDFLASFDRPIAAAYLDAFDIQHGQHSQYRIDRYRELLHTDITNEGSSQMHRACAEALIPKLVDGGLVVIDDTWHEGNGYAGKGATAVPLLLQHGFHMAGSTRTAIALQRGPGAKA
jgi:hypothetical protein